MRYFFKRDDVPSSPTYQQPRRVFRWEVQADQVISEVYDAEFGGWRHDPTIIAWTGLGGSNNIVEATKQEADAFIERAGG